MSLVQRDQSIHRLSTRVNELETREVFQGTLGANTLTSDDADSVHYLGRAATGYVGHSDYAGFAHRDSATTTDYALAQSSAGSTWLNAANSESILFRNNNSTLLELDGTNLDLTNTPIVSDDADTAYTFGRAKIDGSLITDNFTISHRDWADSTNYAFRQTANGSTMINSRSGWATYIRQGNTDRIQIDSDFDFLDTAVTSNDADTSFVLGRAHIGYVVTYTDTAGFCHRDHTNDPGFRQNSGGDAIINAPTGQRVMLRINNTTRLEITGSTFRITDDCEPSADNTYDVGTSGRRWDDVYATNGTIQTSDPLNKREIEDSSLGLDFIKRIRPIQFRWNNGNRRHFGLSAAQVKETIDDLGIDSADFAPYVSSEEGPDGIRYSQFIPLMLGAIKELSEEVELLKGNGGTATRPPRPRN